MSDVIPCQRDPELRERIEEFAEILRTRSHMLQNVFSEEEFYENGVFEGAIQRIRGQISATLREKKDFANRVFSMMQDRGCIVDWQSAGSSNRHDYSVSFPDGRVAAIELKGCLDGNNTNISVRPPHADEFIVWSMCQNKGADPRHNVWSGIHSRISAEFISESKIVDGLVVWDWLCNSFARPCPKAFANRARTTSIGPHTLPPPCLYLFPARVPAPRNNPNPRPQTLEQVRFMNALHRCFGGEAGEVNYVHIQAGMDDVEVVRTTTIERGGRIMRRSGPTPIQRE